MLKMSVMMVAKGPEPKAGSFLNLCKINGINIATTTEREMPKNEITKHPTLSNIMDSSTGGLQTFVKTFENEIYAFGKNSHSQLGIKTTFLKRTTPIRVFEG